MPITIHNPGPGIEQSEQFLDTTVPVPEHSRSEQLIAVAVFAVSLLYLCVFRRYVWIDPDEGIILQGAQRILDGQVLYRDFFSFYTPGSYYLLAFVFRVFGDSYSVAHTLLAVIGAGFSPITYLLARRVCGRQTSLLVTALMLLTALPLRFVVLHNWDSTLLACVCLYGAVRLLETSKPRWAFVTASFVSLTTLFEQSKGFGLLLGIGAGFIFTALRAGRPALANRRQLTSIALGLGWPLLITLAYFTYHHALIEMLKSWFWPVAHYSAANRVPYGYDILNDDARHRIFAATSFWVLALKILVFGPLLWFPLFPILGLALLIRMALRALTDRPILPAEPYYTLVSAAISGLLLSVIIVRTDYEHFVYLQPIFFLVLAWMLDGATIRSRAFSKVAPMVGVTLATSLFFLGGALLLRARADHTITTRRGVLTAQLNDEVSNYVQDRVPAGEKILIYPYESTYYYLTGTYSPARLDYFQPGMHTPQQQRELLADLIAHPVRVILYDPLFADHARQSWPNTRAGAFASDPVADYIAHEYRPCATLHSAVDWQFVFMIRKELSCP